MAAAALGIIPSILGFFGNKSGQEDANQQAEEAYQNALGTSNQNYQNYLAWQNKIAADPTLKNIVTGPRTSTTDQEVTNRINELVAPEYSAAMQPMVNMLTKQYTNQLAAPALPPGYLERQAANIESAAEPQREAEASIAAEHGVDPDVLKIGSPTEGQVAGQIADLQAQAPMMAENIMNQRRAAASGWAQANQGKRTTGTNTTSSMGTTTMSADPSAVLAYYGMLAPKDKAIVGMPQTTSPWTSGIQGLIGGGAAGLGMAKAYNDVWG